LVNDLTKENQADVKAINDTLDTKEKFILIQQINRIELLNKIISLEKKKNKQKQIDHQYQT
jgi:hypothetical protein